MEAQIGVGVDRLNQFDSWRQLALQEMQRILKPQGFKKKGINFHRLENGVWMAFNFQSCSWNMAGAPWTAFGNIGLLYVVDPDVKDAKKPPHEMECHWRARVRGTHGQAFDITSDAEAEAAGHIVAVDGLGILDQVVRRYPTASEMIEAHKANSSPDHDLSPWAFFQGGILLRDLERSRAKGC